ncbi:MAG: glycosyltransferase family 2 protein [Vicinamibacteria bacterium]|nr:glycosyltransferase family 2 protein [Vicinamibacteria bacterium]
MRNRRAPRTPGADIIVPVPKISAVLIAQNEEDRIEAALRSVAFCDEVLVVDGGSVDSTVARVNAAGVRLLERGFDAFVAQKNFAVDQARHDIVLSLDADEEVSHVLRKGIQEVCALPSLPRAGYRIPRVTHYLGHEIRATDWYPDWQLRLFDRRRGRFAGDLVHESVNVDGPVGRLEGEIIHRPYRDEEEHLRRIDRYTTLWAQAAYAKGRRARLGVGEAASVFAFIRNYIFKRGLLMGWIGYRISRLNAFYVRQKFAKLKALQTSRPS